MEQLIQVFGFLGLATFVGFLWLGVVSWGLEKVLGLLDKKGNSSFSDQVWHKERKKLD